MNETGPAWQAGNREALLLWHKVTMEGVRRDAPDLSARQLGICMTVALEPGPHTVRSLSNHLRVSKPAICRALDTLSKLRFVERRIDPDDRRNVFIHSTSEAVIYLNSLSELIMDSLAEIG